MVVRRRNIDTASRDEIALAGKFHTKLAMPAQDLRQEARGAGMHDDEDRHTAVSRQPLGDASKGFEAAAGSADRDNRVRDHERSLVSGFLQSENAAREGEVAGIRGDAGRERAPETQ